MDALVGTSKNKGRFSDVPFHQTQLIEEIIVENNFKIKWEGWVIMVEYIFKIRQFLVKWTPIITI